MGPRRPRAIATLACASWAAAARDTWFAPLPAGRWVLRAVDLRPSETEADRWDSRFVTLAFELLQNGSSLSSNARSTNQVPAIAAMSPEPPASTARR
jgi:hypothetical protein